MRMTQSFTLSKPSKRLPLGNPKVIAIRKALPYFIFTLALAARLVPGPRTIDDAFITFRYARNLVDGHGFVYNTSERVLGTTTPLYTLTMATIGLLPGFDDPPFPIYALLVNALFDGLTCLVLLRLGRHLGARWAGVGAALVWAIAPFSVTFAIGGLETSLFVLLLTALGLAAVEKRYTLLAFLAGLSLLTRPDALILLGPLALDRLFTAWRDPDKRIQWSEVVASLGPLVLWGIFATIFFGSPISHSVTAKTMAYQLRPEEAFIRLLQHYATPFLGHLTFGQTWIGIGLLLYLFLFVLGASHILKTNTRFWPFVLYPVLYLFAFSIANPLIFRWYLTPPLPFYILTLLIGAEKLLTDIANRSRVNRPALPPAQTIGFQPIIILIVIVLPMALSLRDWTLQPDHGSMRPAPSMAWYQLELYYRQAADILAPHLQSNSVLAASDVGVLGFFTGVEILDTVGLNSPVALDYYPVDPAYYVINLATSPDLIHETQPDYLVLLEVYGREGLFKDPRFQASYDLLEKIPNDIYGSEGMLIFARLQPQ